MWLSTGDDQVISLWTAENGMEAGRGEGHDGLVTGLAWRPNSTWIAVARSDGVALLIQTRNLLEPSPA